MRIILIYRYIVWLVTPFVIQINFISDWITVSKQLYRDTEVVIWDIMNETLSFHNSGKLCHWCEKELKLFDVLLFYDMDAGILLFLIWFCSNDMYMTSNIYKYLYIYIKMCSGKIRIYMVRFSVYKTEKITIGYYCHFLNVEN